MDTTIISKFTRTEASGTRNRLCIGDFDTATQAVLRRAISHYRAQLNNKCPFPDQVEDRNAAANGWVQACTELNVHIEFDEDISKLVRFLLLSLL
jgi:1-aminocyclopropane-1-carboxylate deaminase/D-cysteine desulfhydrase-like pyridoxal-dependent ACC family enzyme